MDPRVDGLEGAQGMGSTIEWFELCACDLPSGLRMLAGLGWFGKREGLLIAGLLLPQGFA